MRRPKSIRWFTWERLHAAPKRCDRLWAQVENCSCVFDTPAIRGGCKQTPLSWKHTGNIKPSTTFKNKIADFMQTHGGQSADFITRHKFNLRTVCIHHRVPLYFQTQPSGFIRIGKIQLCRPCARMPSRQQIIFQGQHISAVARAH